MPRRTRSGAGGGSCSASGSPCSLLVGGAAAFFAHARQATSPTPTSSSAPSRRRRPAPSRGARERGSGRPRRPLRLADVRLHDATARATCRSNEPLRPPFTSLEARQRCLLEFPPVIGGSSLYLLNERRRARRDRQADGQACAGGASSATLAAASPAAADGDRLRGAARARQGRRGAAGRVVGARRQDGQDRCGRATCPAAAESSPLLDGGTALLRHRERDASTRCARPTAPCAGRSRPAGAVKGGARARRRQAVLRRLRGRVYAIRAGTAASVWARDRRRARASASPPGTSTRRPPSPTAASTSATPTATSTRSRAATGSSPGARDRRLRLRARPPSARCPAAARRLHRLLRRQLLRAGRPHRAPCAGAPRRRQDLRRRDASIGDIVYFADLGDDARSGLGARTGRKVVRARARRLQPGHLRRARRSTSSATARCTRCEPLVDGDAQGGAEAARKRAQRAARAPHARCRQRAGRRSRPARRAAPLLRRCVDAPPALRTARPRGARACARATAPAGRHASRLSCGCVARRDVAAPLQPHRHARRGELGLGLGDRVLPVVEDRRGQRPRRRPPAAPSTMCSGSPAPPEAMTGTSTASATARVSARS